MAGGRMVRVAVGLVIPLVLLVVAVGVSANTPPGASGDGGRLGRLTAIATASAAPAAATAHVDEDHDEDVDGAENDHDATSGGDVDEDHDTDDDDVGDATDDASVGAHGACTSAATWRAEVEKDDGALEFELVVSGSQPNTSWLIEVSQNGTKFYSGNRTSSASGVFGLEVDRPDGSGTDTFAFSARQASNGQTCTGKVSI